MMPIVDGLLPENFVSKHEESKLNCNENSRKWYSKYRSDFLLFKAHFCRLNFEQNINSNQNPKSKEPLWSNIVYLFFLYCTIKLLVATYNHFTVDFHKYKLDKFDQVMNCESANSTPLRIEYREKFRNQLVTDYKEVKNAAKRMGAPYINLHFGTFVAKIILISFVIVCYFVTQLYYRFVKPVDCRTIYIIIAPDKLQESIDSIIRDQVNKFIVSSRIYIEQPIDEGPSSAASTELRQCESHEGKIEASSKEGHDHPDEFGKHLEHQNTVEMRIQTMRISENHKFLAQQVKLMALNGIFQPFNRRREWLEKMADTYGVMDFSIFMGILWFLAFLMFLLPYSHLIEFELERDPLDLWFNAEQWAYGAIGVTTGSFYLSLTAMLCIDQIHSVSKLCHLVKNSISKNTYKLKEFLRNDEIRVYRSPLTLHKKKCLLMPLKNSIIVAQTKATATKTAENIRLSGNNSSEFLKSPSLNVCSSFDHFKTTYVSDPVDKAINLSLLHLLMSYKIFVKLLRPSLDSFPVLTTISLFFAFFPPILTRLLIAYLSYQQKKISILLCVICLFAADGVFVMVNRLHARCLDIYRHLQSLMAHIIEMDHIANLQTGREVYDRHLVWMLRKELNHPDRLTDQFATRLLWGQSKMTYANLMKYHFWWGVLTISIIVIDPTLPNANDIFGGVWRFYSNADADVYRFLHKASKV